MERFGTLLLALTPVTAVGLLFGCAGGDEAWGPSYYPGPPVEEATEDSYEAVGTNPYVNVAHDPFSTFAVDVDTASYDIFVRDIEDGRLPDPDSVRVEEYVNYFNYDYPAPERGSEIPFALDLAATAHPMGRQVANLRVAVQATRREDEPKLPTNLVFLVDTSGSMGGDKLALAQFVLRETLPHLDPTDTVSIVSYAGDVAVRLRPTPASNPRAIEQAINGLTSGGGTNGASGINLAYDQAEAGFIEGGFNHVVLCTDGDFNIGISDSDELVALIEEKRETGVTLTALGFGSGNLNDAMMERVTNAGNGMYSVLSSEPQATRYAAERMLQTAQHVAKDMKIQVEFNPEHVVAYRLLGYENRALEDWQFRDDTVDAGEIGAGHRVTALYEIVLAGQSVPSGARLPEMLDGEPVDGVREIDASEFVRVKVRWKDVGASTEDPAHELTSSLVPEDVTQSIEDADVDLLWASSIVAFAEILKNSPFANEMDLPRIQQLIEAQVDRDVDRAAFVAHFAATRALLGR